MIALPSIQWIVNDNDGAGKEGDSWAEIDASAVGYFFCCSKRDSSR